MTILKTLATILISGVILFLLASATTFLSFPFILGGGMNPIDGSDILYCIEIVIVHALGIFLCVKGLLTLQKEKREDKNDT